jgi:hypothetical protein
MDNPNFNSENPPEKAGMIYEKSLQKPVDTTQAREAGYNYAQRMIAERQENKSGEFYDKTPEHDLNEAVYIARERDGTYENMDPGFEKVRRSEAPSFIFRGIEAASEKGSFLKTLDHYEKFLETISDEIEPGTMKQVRSFFAEGKTIKTEEGRKDFLKKVSDFVKTVSYGEY